MTVGATITGIGLLTAMGREIDDVFGALCAGRSGLCFPPEGHPVAGWMEVAGVVPDIDPGEVLPRTEAKSVDRYVLLAMAAADDALRDAGLVVGRDVDPDRTAVLVSTGGGGFGVYEQYDRARLERGASAVSPYLLPGILSNMAAARIAMKYGIRGYSAALVMACAAGTQSIVEAVRLIHDGEADVVVCGAGEASLLATIGAGFTNARVLARGWADPAAASRPFDKRRNGIVVSEGACVLVVERTDFASARLAPGYADVIGWGCSTDAYHPTKPRPDGEGAMASMRKAIARAGCEPSDVDYVNAHATSTTIGDVAEALAINTVFGPHTPAVSSIKSVTGHMLGASGAVEAAATALSVSRGILPPTANLDDPDPKCDLNHVRGQAKVGSVRIALSNTFAFGGHNIGLLFGPAGTATKRTAP
jgi:3-oxoacyl-[acyl-carrier-protein] synthase II